MFERYDFESDFEKQFFDVSGQLISIDPHGDSVGDFELFVPDTVLVPLLISAPHAVSHIREGAEKYAEPDTGALALAIARRLSCLAIVNLSGTIDPNYEYDSAYYDKVRELISEHGIRTYLDLHELSPARSASYAVGSGHCANVNMAPEQVLELVGLLSGEVLVDEHPFAAAHPRRLTTRIHGTFPVVSAIQLEMNSGLFLRDHEKFSLETAYEDVTRFALGFVNQSNGADGEIRTPEED